LLEKLKFEGKHYNGIWKCRPLNFWNFTPLLTFDEALKIDPMDASSWRNKGIALHKLKKYDEAINAYNEALKINTKDATALNYKEIATAHKEIPTELNEKETALKSQKAPGFEIIFAFTGLIIITHLLKRRSNVILYGEYKLNKDMLR
jgi:tetratricopeptide (TPR) repeat protein